MKIHRVEQGSQEWHDLRKGKLTASNAQTIQANGAGLKTYVEKIILEMLPSFDPSERYYGSDMERGNELEPIARAKYEFHTGVKVDEVGFIEMSDTCGASPDGLIGDDGGIEIKARNNSIHLRHLLGEKVDKKTYWQIQMCLWITNRKWWDFVSYNPNFRESIYIERVYRNEDDIQKIRKGVYEGSKMIKEYLNNNVIIKELK